MSIPMPKNDSAGNSERFEGDAEELEERAAKQREEEQDAAAGEDRRSERSSLVLTRVSRGER
jgi:hypothetical protein